MLFGDQISGGSVKLSDVKKKAVEVCARDTDHPQFLCMDLVYMHTLFKWKYNIQDETIVHVSLTTLNSIYLVLSYYLRF